MKVFRAETGKHVGILKTIDRYDDCRDYFVLLVVSEMGICRNVFKETRISLDSLKSELERVTGIPESSQILMTKIGLELKAEMMNEVVRASGKDEYIIFLFNRDSLDPNNSNSINSINSLTEDITLEPPVNVSLPKQNSRGTHYNISDELGNYVNLFQMHHTQGQSFVKTTLIHSEICERLYQEQRVQLMALEVALLNLNKHCCSVVEHYDSFHNYAEKEISRYENIIKSFPANMETLRRIKIHPEIQLSASSVINNKEPHSLADFVSQDKLVALANKGVEAFGQLSKEVTELNNEIRSIQQGTDVLRKKTYDSDFPKMEKALNHNKAYCDVIKKTAEKLEKGVTRVQEQVAKLLKSKVDVEKNIEAIGNLANYQLKEYFPEIKKLDDYIREQVIFFMKCKKATTSTLISNLQQISCLESNIASIPSKLSRLESEVRTKTQDYKLLAHVHQMPSAYAMTLIEIVRRKEYTKLLLAKSQQLAEIMAQFRDMEQKRRDRYRLDTKKYVPIKIPALDDSPPMCEISAVNMNDDRLPSFSKEDIQLFLNLIDQIRPAVMSQASLIRSSFSSLTPKVRIQQSYFDPLSTLQSNLVKLFGQVEGMNIEFENIIEKSSLFEKPNIDNASIMSRMRFTEGRLLSSKGIPSIPQNSRGSRRSRQSFSEDSAVTIGTDLLVEKIKQLDAAEEKIKAYEARIKNLENLLQTNFKASKNSVVAAAASGSETSNLKPSKTIDHQELFESNSRYYSPESLHSVELTEKRKLGKEQSDLKVEFRSLTNEHDKTFHEMEALKKRNSELESQYREMTRTHEKVLRENGVLEQKVLDLEKSYYDLQSSYSEVVDKNVSLESRLKELEASKSRSTNESSEITERYKRLQTEYDLSSARRRELEAMITELEKLNKELELRNISANTLESEQIEVLKDLKQKLRDAESECEKKDLELNSLRKEYYSEKECFLIEKNKLVETYEMQIEQIRKEKDETIRECESNEKNMLSEIEGWKETLEKMNTAREEIQVELGKSREKIRNVELDNSETKKTLEKVENLVGTITEIALECKSIVIAYDNSLNSKKDESSDSNPISMIRKICDISKYLNTELVKTRESLENSMLENSNLNVIITELRQSLQERTEFSRSLSKGLWNYYNNIRTLMRDLGFSLPVKSENRSIIKPTTADEEKDGQIKSPEPNLSDSYHAEDLGKFFANDYVDDQSWPKDRYETLITLTSKVNLDEVHSTIRKMPADAEALAKKHQKEAKLYKEKYKKVNMESKDKISFKNFKMGDLALFLPTRNTNAKNCWSAFNINYPNHYLQITDKISGQLLNRTYLVARIVDITEFLAGSDGSNPFDLPTGVKYYLLDVEGWQNTINNYHSRRSSTKSESGNNNRFLIDTGPGNKGSGNPLIGSP
ncbi:17447_t:CDS:10 [Acaulospora morrowiae]|uniref:Autophagy-related protein 11 n=1 Tax=Acaulospora morrowiae TaxID=94023 RepID=A0A9N8V6L6_9GLOM|nr:17447_t:CDS:10 [Acaulospora morrowiae]